MPAMPDHSQYSPPPCIHDATPTLATAPKAQAIFKAAGAKFLAAGQNVTALEGEPPKKRVTIQVYDSLEKLLAAGGGRLRGMRHGVAYEAHPPQHQEHADRARAKGERKHARKRAAHELEF
mgnify:CR=1 FL=1